MFIKVTVYYTDGGSLTTEIERRSVAYVEGLIDKFTTDPNVTGFDVKAWATRTSARLVKVDGHLVPTEGPDRHVYKDFDGTISSSTRIAP